MGRKLTVEQLRAHVRYDPQTGGFTMRTDEASIYRDAGRQRVVIRGQRYAAARLAILDQTGSFPEEGKCVDHINGNPLDDRISNLRVVTHLENMRNRRMSSNNTSGVSGVDFEKDRERWQVRIRVGDRRRVRIGRFKTLNEALIARKAAVKKYHGDMADMTIYPLLA